MNIDEIQAKIKENAIKATEILEAEDGDTTIAAKLLKENEELEAKTEMLKSINQVPVKAKTMESEIYIPGASSTNNVKMFSPTNISDKEKIGYAFGQMAKMVGKNDKKAYQWLKDNGFYKGQSEDSGADGAYLVPQILAREIIFLRQQYGVARAHSRVLGMNSDNLNVPRNLDSTTAYWPDQNTNITPSQITFSNVQILAKKLAVLTQVSSELNEDSLVDVGSALARDMAYVISYNEDLACFNGDGSGTYGGITGIFNSIAAVNGGANAGWIYSDGNATADWNNVTLADLRKCTAAVASYADTSSARWFMHRAFFQEVVCNLLDALNGNGFNDIANAPGPNPTLFGYPVVYTQVMSKDSTPAADTPLALFGNLDTGSILGTRRDLRVQVSDQAGFISDSLYFRATERFGFQYFDVPVVGSQNGAGSAAVLVANN